MKILANCLLLIILIVTFSYPVISFTTFSKNNDNYFVKNENICPFNTHLLTVCSFNILASVYAKEDRYSNIKNKTFLSWKHRQPLIFKTLSQSLSKKTSQFFDIIGLQEVDKLKIKEFFNFANKNNYVLMYSERLLPKKDGIALLINKNRFNILDCGDKVLIKNYSEVAQYFILQEKFTKQIFIVINCHLTYEHNVISRENQVKSLLLMLKELKENFYNKEIKILIFGDFNTEPYESPIKLMENSHLKRTHHFEMMTTDNELKRFYWSFCSSNNNEKKVVDYIWFEGLEEIYNNGDLSIGLRDESIPNEHFGSDHLPLVAQFKIV
ncbi:hypothetical protein ABK040_011196 [Willaertia magna]